MVAYATENVNTELERNGREQSAVSSLAQSVRRRTEEENHLLDKCPHGILRTVLPGNMQTQKRRLLAHEAVTWLGAVGGASTKVPVDNDSTHSQQTWVKSDGDSKVSELFSNWEEKGRGSLWRTGY